MQCIVKNSEYRMKLEQSGIPEPIFEAFATEFMNKYGRLPNLDEIPGANSTHHLEKSLHIVEGSAKIEDILATTGAATIQEANIALNDQYTDLDISIMPLSRTALVGADRRPSPYTQIDEDHHTTVDNPTPHLLFSNMFQKLRNQYGIELNTITDRDLEKWKDIPEVRSASAFVHDGQIYINTDLADIDAPIHELTHILLGSIRFKHPDLYFDLVKTANQFELYDVRRSEMPNKSEEDAMEEIFVEEVGKYLAGLHSAIGSLPENIQYELHYNIKRLLDTALMGQYSVKSIRNEELYQMSFPQLVSAVNSMILQPFNMTGLDDARLHRMLANEKSDLISKGDLTENCE